MELVQLRVLKGVASFIFLTVVNKKLINGLVSAKLGLVLQQEGDIDQILA